MKTINIIECFEEVFTKALSELFNIDEGIIENYFDNSKLVFTKTPSSELGDYGLSLHYLFHVNTVDRSLWNNYGSKLIDLLEKNGLYSKCFVNKVVFVNGYVNLYIDYKGVFREITRIILDKSFYEIKNLGKGELVVIEHTSANPVHPLHIGSGRNTVIGDTYARLLEYLGFRVNKRFYVNDMGRQVATLIYGYLKLAKQRVEPESSVKIDHWYGAVYALTNILIEKHRLIREIENNLVDLRGRINIFEKEVEELTNTYKLYRLFNLLVSISRVSFCSKYVSDIVNNVKRLLSVVKSIIDSTTDASLKSFLEKHYSELSRVVVKIDELVSDLSDYAKSETRLSYTYPEIYSVLSREICDYELAEEEISDLMRSYERGDAEVANVFKKVVSDVLKGFEETFRELSVFIDNYDYESLEPGTKYLKIVIDSALRTPYADVDGFAVSVDLDRASLVHGYIRKLFEPDQPGKVVLRRSDGTTLYTTRDIAYSLFKTIDLGACRVYNVIASEQLREQKQVKSILYLIGYREVVDKIVHFSYEMVSLKDTRMSGRRGEYLSIDELIRAYMDVIIQKYVENQLKLGLENFTDSVDYYRDITYKLSIACTRALLLSVDPSKPLVFDYRRLEDYDIGAWIIYTFVRLQSILRKAHSIEPLDNIDYYIDKLRELTIVFENNVFEINDIEKNIVEKIAMFQQILLDAYRYMKPNKILEYARDLCNVLNKMYESIPILNERDVVKKSFRLSLIILSLIILKDLLWIMGLPEIKRI